MSGTPAVTVVFKGESHVDDAQFEGTSWAPQTAEEYAADHQRNVSSTLRQPIEIVAVPSAACD